MTGCRGSNSAVVLLVPEPSASRTSQPGNTLASTMPGSKVLGSRIRPTIDTQCAGRRWRISTERRVTFERCRLCSDRRSSKAPPVISGSRWMTLSASQGRSNSEGTSRPCHLARPQLFGHEPTSAALKRTPGRGTFPVRRHGEVLAGVFAPSAAADLRYPRAPWRLKAVLPVSEDYVGGRAGARPHGDIVSGFQ